MTNPIECYVLVVIRNIFGLTKSHAILLVNVTLWGGFTKGKQTVHFASKYVRVPGYRYRGRGSITCCSDLFKHVPPVSTLGLDKEDVLQNALSWKLEMLVAFPDTTCTTGNSSLPGMPFLVL